MPLFVSSQKRGETSRRFERLNQFFEETFGTVCPYPQNIEKIPLFSRKSPFHAARFSNNPLTCLPRGLWMPGMGNDLCQDILVVLRFLFGLKIAKTDLLPRSGFYEQII